MKERPLRVSRLTFHCAAGQQAGATDADLLTRWAHDRDEIAFELLVRRHSPMVLAACRRLLPDANDADDAFQATFLVLARRAATVVRGDALVAWLHRVAVRAALRVRRERVGRANREGGAIDEFAAPQTPDCSQKELKLILDEEIARLSTRHRAVFVLCCLEGKTGEEAGRLLGCPSGTISSRLTRARNRLRRRLTQRGFAPALVIAALAKTTDASAVVLDSTVSAILALDARWTSRHRGNAGARPEKIAEGVIKTMSATKLKAAILLCAVGLLTLGGVLAASNSSDDSTTPRPGTKVGVNAKDSPSVPVVRIVRPQPGGLERTTRQQFRVESEQQADLYPSVAGVLKKVDVEIGERVKRGQLLVEIDAQALALDARQAIASVEQMQALLKEAEAHVSTAKADIVAARGVVKQRDAESTGAKANLTYRKRQFERLAELLKQASIESKVVDEAEGHFRAAESQASAALAAVENAKADVEVRNSKLMQAESAVATAKANAEAAKISLEKVQLALNKTRMTAPFDGIVTRRNCAVGDDVRAGDLVPHSPLLTIVRTDLVRVVVAVPDREALATQPGVPAELRFDALQGERVNGKVARIGFVIDPSNNTMRAEIDVANPKAVFRPGMVGTAVLHLGTGPANAFRVPDSAVLSLWPPLADEKGNGAVYVYRDGKARMTRVRIGVRNGKEAEILSGVTAEDDIVANPKGLLPADEVTVEIEKPKTPK